MKYRTECHANIIYVIIPHHIYILRILNLFFTVTVCTPHMNILYLCHRIHYTIIIYSCHIYVQRYRMATYYVDCDLKKYNTKSFSQILLPIFLLMCCQLIMEQHRTYRKNTV